jgi:hypothetical protein
MVLGRPRERSTTKLDPKNSLYPLKHFTEQLVDVFGKLPGENDLDHESSTFLIQQLKSTPGLHLQQYTFNQRLDSSNKQQHHTAKQRERTLHTTDPRRQLPLSEWLRQQRHQNFKLNPYQH